MTQPALFADLYPKRKAWWIPTPIYKETHNFTTPCDECGLVVPVPPRYKIPYPPGHGMDGWGNGNGDWVHVGCKEAAVLRLFRKFNHLD